MTIIGVEVPPLCLRPPHPNYTPVTLPTPAAAGLHALPPFPTTIPFTSLTLNILVSIMCWLSPPVAVCENTVTPQFLQKDRPLKCISESFPVMSLTVAGSLGSLEDINSVFAYMKRD